MEAFFKVVGWVNWDWGVWVWRGGWESELGGIDEGSEVGWDCEVESVATHKAEGG